MEIWLPVCIGVAVNAMVAAYFYGGISKHVTLLAERVTDGEREHRDDSDNQWKKLTDHGERISWLEAKSNGKHTH